MKQSYENLAIEQTLKQQDNEFKETRAMAFLQDHFQYKPKLVKYQNLIVGLGFMAIVCNIISACTGFTFVNSLLKSFIHPYVAIAFAVLILAGLEFSKHQAIYPFFKEWRQNRKFSFLHFGLISMLVVTSLFFSYNGGEAVVYDYTTPPKLESVDSKKQYYDNQITAVRLDIKAARENIANLENDHYKTAARKIMHVTIPGLQNQITTLQQQRDIEVNSTTSSNAKAVVESQKQVSLNAYTVSLIAVSCDLVLILLLNFISLLLYEAAREQQIISVPISGHQAPDLTPIERQVPGRQLKVLEHAGKHVITSNYPIANSGSVDESKTVAHLKENKETAYYTRKQVLNHINIHEKREKEAMRKVYNANTEKDKQRYLDSVTTNRTKKEYWTKKLQEFQLSDTA